MTDAPVLRRDDGAVTWLTLNRPDALNALSPDLLDHLDGHVRDLERDDTVRAVVVSATGRAFCAGADLTALTGPDGELDPSRLLAFIRRAGAVFGRLAALPTPVIAAVNGIALAGGLELVLHCDLVVASESARLGDGHINYGLLPGAGGAARLPRVIGPTRAKYLAFTGELLPAAECRAMGLVNEVVPAERLADRVSELAGKLATRSPSALRLFKRAIDDGLEQPLPTALRLEHLATAEHLHSGDVQEGLAAFQAKRAPNFGKGNR
jgi:enoyl-CoA hydratase/carnithine racemase